MNYEKRIFLTIEQALNCLIIEEGQVHNYIQMGNALVGADWDMQSVKDLFEAANSIEIGGKQCMEMNHGIVAIKKNEAYFFNADNNKIKELEDSLNVG